MGFKIPRIHVFCDRLTVLFVNVFGLCTPQLQMKSAERP